MNTTAVKPASVLFIGWSSVFTSGVMILVNFFSLATYSVLNDLGGIGLSQAVLSQYIPASLSTVMELYEYSRWWTMYGVFFFAFVMVAGIQFVRLKAWGRKALELACWAGFLNAAIDTTLSYLIWSKTQTAFAEVLRGVGGGQYSFVSNVGFVSIIVGFMLWIVPCGGLIVFLRRQKIREIVSQ